MPPFVYCVLSEFELESDATRYLEWMRSKHLAEVCAVSGASAELVRLDGAPIRLEARYVFASRESFAAYERDHAPRLRAEGLQLFPVGVRFTRTTGERLA